MSRGKQNQLQLDNFLKLKGLGWQGFIKLNLWKQDNGYNSCAAAFVQAVEKACRLSCRKRFLRWRGSLSTWSSSCAGNDRFPV
jgi:hypothetical protein